MKGNRLKVIKSGGGDFLSEKMSEVYEAYDMEILGVTRGRGAMILKTDKGIRQISPFDGSEERLEQEKRIQGKSV